MGTLRRSLTAGILGAALLLGAGGAGAIEPVRTGPLAELDAIVERGIEEEVFPGAVLVVGKPGEILWAQAYGRKTYEEDADPVRLDSVFDLASVTKVAATSAMAWKLLAEGQLSLDDRVSDYHPGFRSGGKEEVTVRDLLTHTSGLRGYPNRNRVDEQRQEGQTHAEALVSYYTGLELAYPLRTAFNYGCVNFIPMAHVNQTVAGQSAEEYLRDHIYGPLGMNDTTFRPSEEQVARAMPALRRDDDSLLTGEAHDPLANYHGAEERCPGNAGLFSTGPDLARFCEMILNNGRGGGQQIIDEEIVRLAATNLSPEGVETPRGLGWGIYTSPPWATEKNQEDGHRVIGHTGYTGTLIWLDQHSQTYFVLLTNRVYPDDSPPEGLSINGVRRQVAEAVLRAQPEYAGIFAERDAEEAAEPEEPAGK